jgi:hypothetical protein
MALTDYKTAFDNAYQEVFQKVLVGKDSIANFRFEPTLKYGGSVTRFAYDISGVRVRNTSRGSASTIDSVTDSSESLTINIEKEAVFHISDGEVTQTGPLNPGEVIGGQVAIKVASDLDARILYEAKNASYAFDNGDLTSIASDLTPITLSSTTVPQMISRAPAKLKYRNNQMTQTNMCWIVDGYAASDFEQYLLSKNINIAEAVFKNGYAGTVHNAELFVSENLTGEALITLSGNPSNGETMTIGGVTITFVSSIGSTAGNVLIGAAATNTADNLAGLINNPGTTSSTQVALSADNQVLFTDTLRLAATNSSGAVTVVGTGSGRLIITEAVTNLVVTRNMLHCIYGKKGSVDVVVQDLSEVDMRPTDDRRGTNVFSSYLAGIKTYADGAKKFLDVKIAA